MAGIYTSPTLTDALAELGDSLADPTHVHWTAAELTLYIQQALRTYNALTNHFRDEATFQSASPEAFYDLPTVLPTLRAQDYTVTEAVNQLCYHLLETIPSGGLWTGTDQYSLEDVLSALQQARDAFLFETGIVQTHATLLVDPFPTRGVVDLDEAIINLRRLGWGTDDGIVTILRRDDQWGLANYRQNWQTASSRPPKAYSVSAQPPLKVQLAPLSTVAGTLNMLTVNRGSVPSLADPTQSLGVPNDWAWVVLFGALGKLFQRDGLAFDPLRAEYCIQRYEHGVKMARAAAVVLSAQIEEQQVTLSSVADADFYSASWPLVPAIPKKVLTAGHTVVALCPPPGVPPGGGDFDVLLQVVRNAPVPTVGADVIQIGAELIGDILDYAQHLALLKEGAAQIQAGKSLLDNFMSLCGTTVAIQSASQPEEKAAAGQTPQDAAIVAYRN